ncbi:hypothetical protein M5K25_023661 [Dendrobium thyrsiflorum]|uniref:Uncharacterized protein n=1 Tax=Dendrobium thyrsiflorum TaxID=117978 RepID=A0ABD0U8W8_DENTH
MKIVIAVRLARLNVDYDLDEKHNQMEWGFFSWFDETQAKSLSEGISDEVAEIIKEDLWPNPLRYFNNEADEEDFEGDEDDDEKESPRMKISAANP